jgi:hypothetical protein
MVRALLSCLLVGLSSVPVLAQELKVEVLKEPAPEAVATPIRQTLEAQGYRVFQDGKPLVDVWLRKAVPASSKPEGAKGSVLYPFLKEGEVVGAARYAAEGQDYRDQIIAPGTYTLRYGLRLDDGNHANVSPYKDYFLLLPAAKDTTMTVPDAKALQKASAGASGTTHPAVLNLALPPGKTASASAPTLTHEEMDNIWGVVVPLNVAVAGGGESTSVPLNLVVVGASAG